MWGAVLILVATLSIFVSDALADEPISPGEGRSGRQVASRCDRTTEAQRIAKFADKVSRRGETLFLKLKDGKTIFRKGTGGDWMGYYDREGNVRTAHTFRDFIDPWYVIGESYFEGCGTEFINRDTGKAEQVGGYAKFSPDKSRFLITPQFESSDEMAIRRMSRKGMVTEWAWKDASEGHYGRWTDSSTVELSDEDNVFARLKRNGISWNCSGSPRVCTELETSGASKSNAKVHTPPLLQGRAEVAVTDSNSLALVGAAMGGNLELIKSLIAQGVDVNAADEDGWTALERASDAGQTDVVRFLLEKSTDANKKEYLNPPLVLASSGGHREAAKCILDKGADVNAQGAMGRTALMHAAWKGSAELVKLLVSKGANANLRDDYCSTALNGPLNTLRKGRPEVAKLLLAGAADANAEDDHGETALKAAISANNLEMVRLLVRWGADVNAKNRRGWTPLMESASEGHLKIVKFLLDNGANVSLAAERRDRTSLKIAKEKGHKEIVALLKARGAKE